MTHPSATGAPYSATKYVEIFNKGNVVDGAAYHAMNTPASSISFKEKASQFFSNIAKLFDFKFSFSFERLFSNIQIDWLVNTIEHQCDDFVENSRGVTPFDGEWSKDSEVEKEGNVEYVIGDKGQVYIKREVLKKDMPRVDYDSIQKILGKQSEQQERDQKNYAANQARRLKAEVEKAPESDQANRLAYVKQQLEAKKQKHPGHAEMYQEIQNRLD